MTKTLSMKSSTSSSHHSKSFCHVALLRLPFSSYHHLLVPYLSLLPSIFSRTFDCHKVDQVTIRFAVSTTWNSLLDKHRNHLVLHSCQSRHWNSNYYYFQSPLSSTNSQRLFLLLRFYYYLVARYFQSHFHPVHSSPCRPCPFYGHCCSAYSTMTTTLSHSKDPQPGRQRHFLVLQLLPLRRHFLLLLLRLSWKLSFLVHYHHQNRVRSYYLHHLLRGCCCCCYYYCCCCCCYYWPPWNSDSVHSSPRWNFPCHHHQSLMMHHHHLCHQWRKWQLLHRTALNCYSTGNSLLHFLILLKRISYCFPRLSHLHQRLHHHRPLSPQL